MKVSRRVVSFIVAFVIFAGSFLVPAPLVNAASAISASEVELEVEELEESSAAVLSSSSVEKDGFKFGFSSWVRDKNTQAEYFRVATKYYYSGDTFILDSNNFTADFNSSVQVVMSNYIEKSDGSLMAKKGDKVELGLYNFYASMIFANSATVLTPSVKSVDSLQLQVLYNDDSSAYLSLGADAFAYNSSTDRHNIVCSFDAKKDIRKIRFLYYYTPTLREGISGSYSSSLKFQHDEGVFNLEIEDKEVGLLGGILDSVTDFFGGFFDNLIDAIVSVFIPEEGFFDQYFDDLYAFFHEKLGFLLYPFELLAKLLNVFLNLDEGSGAIVIPDIKMFDATLIPATTFNLKEAFGSILGEYYDLYYAFVDLFFLIAFVNLAKSKFDKIVH